MSPAATRFVWMVGGCAFAYALACVAGCDVKKQMDTERKKARPTLVVERTPGQPIARRPAPRTKESARPQPGPHTRFVQVRGESYSGWLRPVTSADHFRPSEADIAALESALPASFAVAVERGDVPAGVDIGGYVRQYVGYRAHEQSSGQSIVEVKLYCPASAHMARKILQVKGGGDCFITTAYEQRTGQFRYWRTNPD